jgi:hypothetical protein
MVWLTRPFESVFLGLGLALSILLMGRREGWRMGDITRRIAAPAALVLFVSLGFSAYYNWRVTNSPLLMPYHLSQQVYGVPLGFYFQKEFAPPKVRHQNIVDVYRWELDARRTSNSLPGYAKRLGEHLYSLWIFYAGGLSTIPLLVAVWGLKRDPSARLIAGLCAFGLAGCTLYAFLFPHYVAAYTAAAAFMIVRGLQGMSKWHIGRVPAGALLAVILMTRVSWRSALPKRFEGEDLPSRAKVEVQIRDIPGKHLVFVRYAPHHNFHAEWVYNEADIDSAPIVWAREIDPTSDDCLMSYFNDRTAWLLEVDASPPRLRPYRSVELQETSHSTGDRPRS